MDLPKNTITTVYSFLFPATTLMNTSQTLSLKLMKPWQRVMRKKAMSFLKRQNQSLKSRWRNATKFLRRLLRCTVNMRLSLNAQTLLNTKDKMLAKTSLRSWKITTKPSLSGINKTLEKLVDLWERSWDSQSVSMNENAILINVLFEIKARFSIGH